MNLKAWIEVTFPCVGMRKSTFVQAEFAADIDRLAFRPYTLCERKGWADDACHCNELVAG